MSQETRTATIIGNHVNQKVRFETNAATFGQLKEEAQTEGLFEGNVRVIVRETRNELSMDKSKLPDGGFTLIVVADKVKSGADTDEYDEMGYHELRSHCVDRGFPTEVYNGPGHSKQGMREALREDDKQNAATKQVSGDVADRFEEMKSRIDAVVKKSREEINDIIDEYGDILPASVIPDYSDFIDEVKSELNL